MHEEHSESTVIGQDARTERVFRTTELLRSELTALVHPDALSEMLDLAVRSVQSTDSVDVLREMRATIAGILLNRVGEFMVATQPPSEQVERASYSGAHRRPVAA
jgi:hypothetical protein